LNHNADNDYDREYVSAGVCELVIPVPSEFECDAESFDRHDGY